jgi:hypothetical protein
MISVLDNDVDRPARPQYPVTELVRTYLQRSRSASLVDLGTRREPTSTTTAQDLWDYLGDFA